MPIIYVGVEISAALGATTGSATTSVVMDTSTTMILATALNVFSARAAMKTTEEQAGRGRAMTVCGRCRDCDRDLGRQQYLDRCVWARHGLGNDFCFFECCHDYDLGNHPELILASVAVEAMEEQAGRG